MAKRSGKPRTQPKSEFKISPILLVPIVAIILLGIGGFIIWQNQETSECQLIPDYLAELDLPSVYTDNGYTVEWRECLIFSSGSMTASAGIEEIGNEKRMIIHSVTIPSNVSIAQQVVLYRKEVWGHMVVLTHPINLTGRIETNRVYRDGLAFLVLSPEEQMTLGAQYTNYPPFNGQYVQWEPEVINGNINITCYHVYAVYLSFVNGQIMDSPYDLYNEVFGPGKLMQDCSSELPKVD